PYLRVARQAKGGTCRIGQLRSPCSLKEVPSDPRVFSDRVGRPARHEVCSVGGMDGGASLARVWIGCVLVLAPAAAGTIACTTPPIQPFDAPTSDSDITDSDNDGGVVAAKALTSDGGASASSSKGDAGNASQPAGPCSVSFAKNVLPALDSASCT